MTPEQLKSKREALNLSQAALASKIGVSKATVEAWEYGKNPVPKWLTLAFAALEFLN